MNMQNATFAPTTTPALDESIYASARIANRIEALLEGLLADLTGSGDLNACGENPASGLRHAADRLTHQLSGIEQLAERVRTATIAPVKQAGIVSGAGGMASSAMGIVGRP